MSVTSVVSSSKSVVPPSRTSSALGNLVDASSDIQRSLFRVPAVDKAIEVVWSGGEAIDADTKQANTQLLKEVVGNNWEGASSRESSLSKREASLAKLAEAVTQEKPLPLEIAEAVQRLIEHPQNDRIKILGLKCLRFNTNKFEVAANALKDPAAHELVRLEALGTVNAIQTDTSFQLIADLLNSPEQYNLTDSLRSALIRSLIMHTDEGQTRELRSIANDRIGEFSIQDRDLIILELCSNPENSEVVIEVLHDPGKFNITERTRIRVIQSISDVNHEVSESLIKIGLDDETESKAVRVAAWDSLRGRTYEASQDNLSKIAIAINDFSEDREVTAAMVRSVSNFNYERVVLAVVEYFGRGSGDVDEEVCSALMEKYTGFEDKRVVNAIADFVHATSRHDLAAKGLMAISGIDTQASREAIAKAMKSDNAQVLRAAYQSYAGFTDPFATDLLKHHVLADALSPEARLFALEGLIIQDTEASVKARVELLNSLQKRADGKSYLLASHEDLYDKEKIRNAINHREVVHLLLAHNLDNLPEFRLDQYKLVTFTTGHGESARQHHLDRDVGSQLIESLIATARESRVPNAVVAIDKLPTMQDQDGKDPKAVCLEDVSLHHRLIDLVEGQPETTGRGIFKRNIPSTWDFKLSDVSPEVRAKVIKRIAGLEAVHHSLPREILTRMVSNRACTDLIRDNLAVELKYEGVFEDLYNGRL